VTLGRKHYLFAGSDGGGEQWALIAALIKAAWLNGVEPHAHLKGVLEGMTNAHPLSRIAV
jgi:hypothetical protein